MMKKQLFNIAISLVTCLVVMAACSEEEVPVANFLDKTELTVGAAGSEEIIQVNSSTEWVAVSSEPWVSISPANGIGSAECVLSIDSSLVNDVRTAKVVFTPKGEASKELVVNQTGFNKMISIKNTEVEIEASGKSDKMFFEAEVTTNVEFQVVIKDENNQKEVNWVSTKDQEILLDRGARPRTVRMRFDWTLNVDPEIRVAHINFIPVKEEDKLEKEAILTLTQKAAPKIEDNRSGDSIALMIIQQRLGVMAGKWDGSENMRNWENLILWEQTDKDLPAPDAVGRVRSVSFMLFSTNDSIPQEIHHLKYLESLSFQTNANPMLKNLNLGTDITTLQYLKNLRVFSYGLTTLPKEFANMKNLEYLDLSYNNFGSLPEVLTPENLPNLKNLIFMGNRRWPLTDLRKIADYEDKDGVGFYMNLNTSNDMQNFKRLFMWNKLEELRLSYNFIEGELPEFEVGETVDMGSTMLEVQPYTEEDRIAFGGDTLMNIVNPLETTGKLVPKIMPNMKHLSLNLNFLTGKLPDWILYHPRFLEWVPSILIFNQEEKGVDSNGKVVGFSNEPKNFDYYYDFFPGFRDKFEMKEEIED